MTERKAEYVGEASANVAQALGHPTRFRILMSMTTPRRRLSPNEFSRETGLRLNHVSYHFRILKKTGAIALAETVPVRGAVEHFFEPVRSALAWEKEWENLGSWVKQLIGASVLRTGVEAMGTALDNGTFEARKDAHMSFDVLRVDETGWKRVAKLLDKTLVELMRIEAESEDRCGGTPPQLASYFLCGFEMPPEP